MSARKQGHNPAVPTLEGVVPKRIVLHLGRAYRGHGRSHFIADPATGALVLDPNLRAVVGKALLREVRRMRYALYLLKARLYFEALWLKGASTMLHLRGNLGR